MKIFAGISLLAVLALPLSLSAATISGTVINRTSSKPAAGDVAVLLDLTQTMQESARSTIDAQGHFSFTVPDLAAMHVVRVEHQKADYYAPVPPNTPTVNLDVYDVGEKVTGVHVYADVSRVQTTSLGLSVTESFTVRNDSKPPRTQLSEHAFDFSLPPDAVVEGGSATGPGGMTIKSTPVSLQGKNRYAFVFPLRPGETHLQVSYQMPYGGSFEFHPAVYTPTDNMAVTLPSSMSFHGSGFQVYHGDSDQPGTATYLATDVEPGTPLVYRVFGSGKLPAQLTTGGPQSGGMGLSAAQGNAGGEGTAPPSDSSDPVNKYKWWMISFAGLGLVILAAFLLRGRGGLKISAAGGAPSPGVLPSALASPVTAGVATTARRVPIAAPEKLSTPPAWDEAPQTMPLSSSSAGPAHGNPMLLDLKEELFAVETERLEGKLPEEDFLQIRSALEVLMRRALSRRSSGG